MSRARKTLLMALFFVLAGAGASEAATIVEYFIMGGWVMYPILVLSVVSWGITFERITVILLQKYKLKVDKVIAMFEESMKKNNGDRERVAEEMVAFLRTKNSVFAQIMETLFQKYREGAEKRMAGTELKGWIQVSVESKAAVLMPRLEKNLVGLAVISNVSTLMGLFGTVIGMIEAFTAMSKSAGGVKADEMAGGIAIALTATAGGLTVAVPSLILYNWVKSYVENYVITIEEASIIFVDTLVG
jgi:biopolymer transport protein ExbB